MFFSQTFWEFLSQQQVAMTCHDRGPHETHLGPGHHSLRRWRNPSYSVPSPSASVPLQQKIPDLETSTCFFFDIHQQSWRGVLFWWIAILGFLFTEIRNPFVLTSILPPNPNKGEGLIPAKDRTSANIFWPQKVQYLSTQRRYQAEMNHPGDANKTKYQGPSGNATVLCTGTWPIEFHYLNYSPVKHTVIT